MDAAKLKAKLIEELRKNIDNLDSEIISLLSSRLEKARQIIKIKDELGESAFSPERERAILNSLYSKSSRLLNKSFIESIYNTIFDESKQIAKEQHNPYSITFLIKDSNALKRISNLPNFIAEEFNLIVAFSDANLDIKQELNSLNNIKTMFFAERFTQLDKLKTTPDFIVPNYFSNFCEESQQKFAELVNSTKSNLVLRYGNGFYIKEFVEILDRYLTILDTPPSILLDRQLVQPVDLGTEINLNSLLEIKPYSTATLFKDMCYLSKEADVVSASKAAFTSGVNSVIVDINTVTNSSIQSIIEFCKMLQRQK